MKFLFISSILYLIHATIAVKVTVSKEVSCKPVRLWELSQSIHYNMAYDWTHHQKIKSWKFSCDKTSSCCKSSYVTNVRVPQFIRNYLSKSLSKNIISKQTCLHKNDFVENVAISNVPIIDVLNVSCTAQTKNKNIVLVTMQTIFDVPWYLYPLENLIQRHVHKSFEDYVDIIHNHLCDHSVD